MSISIPPNYRLRVKQRLQVVAYARQHGMKPAGRHFGLDRKSVRAWVQRWKAGGDTGLRLVIPNDDNDACRRRRSN